MGCEWMREIRRRKLIEEEGRGGVGGVLDMKSDIV
tara:strand:+ start:1090 stop:1194 length:105 start_codon:yes stop_codon:yes gene_type:complete